MQLRSADEGSTIFYKVSAGSWRFDQGFGRLCWGRIESSLRLSRWCAEKVIFTPDGVGCHHALRHGYCLEFALTIPVSRLWTSVLHEQLGTGYRGPVVCYYYSRSAVAAAILGRRDVDEARYPSDQVR